MKNIFPLRLLTMLFALFSFTVSAHTQAPQFFGTIGYYGPSDFYVTDIAFDPKGDVFLANLLRKSVDKYSPNGTLQFRIEDPAFKWPRTLTVDSVGHVYVVDNVVGNIRVYSSIDGTLLDVWIGFDCAGEIHADSQDRILVAMNGNLGCPGQGNEVRIYDTAGVLIDAFGSAGSGPGEFDRNYGITTSADDSIFVTEVGATARFQKFSDAGVFQFESGSFGSGPGEFIGPRSPAVDSAGNIYISDRRNDRIQKFDSSGQFLSMWGSRGLAPEQFFEMDSIEMGAGDVLWVAGYHKHDIQQFDTNGVLIDRWVGHVSGDGEFSEARGVGYVGDKLFVVDGNNQRVQVFDAASGEFLHEFGQRAQGPGTVFNFPRALATGPDGDLYITDDDNIRRIRPDGAFVQMYPRLNGVRSGSLGLYVSDDNIIYQSDYGNHRINKIDADTGALLAQWGSRGTANGQFRSPRGIAIGSDNRAYIADSGNQRIQIFDTNGNYLDEWNLATSPRALAIDRDRGIVYVGEWSRIRAYDYNGTELFSWNSKNSAGGRLEGVYDIVLGESGDSIYISEVNKAQVQRFLFPAYVYGAPSYTMGQGPGIYIWQDEDDGEWHVRFNGDKNLYHAYGVTITTSAGVVDLRTFSFESNDNVTVNNGAISFTGGAKFGEDGIDFYLDAPAQIDVAITLDGQSSEVPVFLGANGFAPPAAAFSMQDTTGDTRPPLHARFTEITATANVTYIGESWGAAWGNLNNDIYPDLYVTNHKKCPDLFRNLGNGSFEKVSGTTEFPLGYCNDIWHDAHGAAWADFDNDGDQDLVNVVDNGLGNIPDPNYFFVNENGILTDRALEFGIDYEYGRGRTPLWLDWNHDGRLDLLEPTSRRDDGIDLPSGLLQQQPNGTFLNIAEDISYGITMTSDFALLSDLNGDERMELVVSIVEFPGVIYETGISPVVDIQSALGIVGARQTRDAAIHDFTGDLQPDIYIVSGEPSTELVLVDDTTIETRLTPNEGSAQAITFAADGEISVEIYPKWRWTAAEVFIGADGNHPQNLDALTLSASDPAVWGAPDYVSGETKGFFIWYDTTTARWRLENSNKPSTNLVVQSTLPITGLAAIGFDPEVLPNPDVYYVWTPSGYVESSAEAGITEPSFARNIAVGDFDNDMDLDMFMAVTGSVANRYNVLWENQGDGTFVKVENFGGEGTLLGRGDTATVADIDLDGFLDVFVTNGKSKAPFDLDGPSQLFRNDGNENHWLQVDLVGIDSNRDAVGARVFLSADGITQIREQTGGVHYRSQNSQRLHFGLGRHRVVDELRIHWPSGHIQVLHDLRADQLIQVHEDGGNGFGPGAPIYTPGSDRGAYVWRNTFDGPYHVRAVNRAGETGFEIGILSDRPLSAVVPVDLAGASEYSSTANTVYFDVLPGQSLEAGVDLFSAPNSDVLLSVSSGSKTNPRMVALGPDGDHPVPAGWIMPSDSLPLHSDIADTTLPGLAVSSDLAATGIEMRLTEYGQAHSNQVTILSNETIGIPTGIGLENGDILAADTYAVRFDGPISYGTDGAVFTLSAPSLIGFTYTRDGLFQPQRVNGLTAVHSEPNAYRLPPVTPYGRPEYDATTEGGLYLWKDENSGWTIRAVGGGSKTYYEGTIISSLPLSGVTGKALENNDVLVLDTENPTTVLFGLNVIGAGADSVQFTVPEGAVVTLDMSSNPDAGVESLRIGRDKWPVGQIPLDLSGWR